MTSSLFSPPVNIFDTRSGGAANGWRLELLYLAVAGVEILWWLPWLLLIVPGAITVPATQIALWAAANLFGALLLTRLLARRRIEDTPLRIMFLIGVALALWLTFKHILPIDSVSNQAPAFAGGKLFFPSPILTAVLVLWFWYRGQTLANSTITPARAAFGFRVGIVLLIGAALIANDRIQHSVLTVLPLFFFGGLSANSLARAASLRVSRDMQRSSFGPGWISFITLIGALLSLVGFVGGILLGGAKFETALGAAHDIFAAIVGLLAVVLLPLVQWLAGLIDSFLGRVQGQINHATAINTQFGNLARNAGPPSATAQMLLNLAPFVCSGAGLVLMAVIIVLMLRRQSRRIGQNGEEHEALNDTAILSSLLAAAHRVLTNALDALAGLTLGSNVADALTVRRLYARLCLLAAKQGYARGSAQTPDEYRLVLHKAFPMFADDIDRLTRAYIEVHYGERTDDPAVILNARQLCDQIVAQQSTR